ncbi:MAG: diphthine--ammonia ligase [Chloroflexi bacterium]|nr:diphthine--ammonia ligase [Chloroflexota bacterium]
MTRYAVMWSGGKDSALALTRARTSGLEVGALLNFIDAASGRVRFHATRAELIAAQANAVRVPLRQYATSWEGFDDVFRRALAQLAADGFAGVIFGDIHLADVRAWYEDRVRAAGLEHVEPLWGDAPADLLHEFVAGGGRAVVTCCEVAKLDESWLGRTIDDRFVAEIGAAGIDMCGENGEYHSFAFAGPAFREPVVWRAGARRTDGGFVQLDLLPPLGAAVEQVIAANADLVGDVRAGRPKAWGKLAGLGVVACREILGRPLTESERRALWSGLWRAAVV